MSEQVKGDAGTSTDAEVDSNVTEASTSTSTKPETKQGKVENIDKILKENELLKSNVSALQKQNNQILTGLKSVFGDEGGEEGAKPEEVISQLQTRLQSLESEAKKGKAETLKNAYINNLTDEDGQPLDSKVKDFLRVEVEVDDPSDEVIKERVSKKLTTLKSLLGDRVAPRGSDDSPERSTRSMGSQNLTANEILARQSK